MFSNIYSQSKAREDKLATVRPFKMLRYRLGLLCSGLMILAGITLSWLLFVGTSAAQVPVLRPWGF